MAKQKMKTVDMGISEDELKDMEEQSKAEASRLKELEAKEKAEKEAKKAAKEAKKEEIQEKIEDKIEENKEIAVKKAPKSRSYKYNAARALVDRTKAYPLSQAIDLAKKTSYSTFSGTVVADAVTKDSTVNVEIAFPHSTGVTRRVVVATDEVITDIEAGKIDFDVLVAAPAMMPKLAKLARVLGPKGLMPNPKNGTISPNPDKRKHELEAGKVTVRSEKKNPLLHVTLGKTNQAQAELIANLEALIKAVGGRKLVKLVVSSTMGPGIKVDLTPYQQTV